MRTEGGTLIEDKDRQQLNDLLEWAVKDTGWEQGRPEFRTAG